MTDLITLAQAKASLRTPTGQLVDDAELQDLVTAATPIIEDLVGPIISRACDEWHDGGSRTIALDCYPVIAVTSVLEAAGSYSRTLTEQVLGGSSYDAYGYTIDKPLGHLMRRAVGSSSAFLDGRANVHVVYTAGRATTQAEVPANMQRAARRLVRWLYQTEYQGQRPNGSAPESVATTQTPNGYTVPSVIKVWLAGDLRVPGLR